MANLRKLLIALAVILVATFTASAQVTPPFACTASAAVPPTVRAEGMAELVGDLVLTCTGGTPTPVGIAVPRINVRIWLNTNLTSRWWDPAMEALLLIDDPVPAQQWPCTSLGGCTAVGVGGPTGLPYATGRSASPPVHNVYQARYAAVNSVVWWGIPIDPPGTTAHRILRIKNVRANANMLGVSPTLVPTHIIMYVAIDGETSVPIYSPTQTVGYVITGLSTSLRDETGTSYGDKGWTARGRPFTQCTDVNSSTFDSATTAITVYHTRVRFSEAFANAFKRRTRSADPADVGATAAQDSPLGIDPVTGLLHNTETGFFNPAFPTTNNLNLAGLASHGTRLRALFTGVPTGMRIMVSTTQVAFSAGNAGRLVTTDTSGAGAYAPTAAAHSALTFDWAEVPISAGTGVAVWEITAADPLAAGWIDFGVALAYRKMTPALGTASVWLGFAPISTVTTAPVVAVPIPRFADVGVTRPVFTIDPCQTNLLFPFVSNQAGFDTGIAIANTSRDPFGTAAESGACTLNYYGAGPGGAPPPAAQTSAVIASGDTAVFTLSAGGTHGITATPGFQGYIIAHCRFRYAHGFAFISDLGATRLSHGYLALVMDTPLSPSRTGFSSESLGM